jgi:hypothetical protein
MRHLILVSAAVVLLGCGGGSGPSGGGGTGGQAGSAGSGGAATGGTGANGGAAGVGASGGSAGAAGSGGATSCTPTGGSNVEQASCDQVSVAVIDRGGKKRLQVRARVTLWSQPGCSVIDEIVLGQQGTVLQTIDAGGMEVPDSYTKTLLEVDAAPAVSDLCANETKRFEAFGFTAKGRTDGGTFEAKCGPADSGGHWPPAVVLSCHSGIADAPFAGNSMVESLGPNLHTTLDAAFRHSTAADAITSVDGNARILPAVESFFGGAPIDPFDTTGWDGYVSETTVSGQQMSQISMFAQDDVLGLELCPAIDPTNPTPDPSPVYLAKITGTTASGPFSSEVYVDICTRAPTTP